MCRNHADPVAGQLKAHASHPSHRKADDKPSQKLTRELLSVWLIPGHEKIMEFVFICVNYISVWDFIYSAEWIQALFEKLQTASSEVLLGF